MLHIKAGSERVHRGARLHPQRELPELRRRTSRSTASTTLQRRRCGGLLLCSGPVKPDVVLFGELLPPRPWPRRRALSARADLMLCIGSSLEVYPVAGFPR